MMRFVVLLIATAVLVVGCEGGSGGNSGGTEEVATSNTDANDISTLGKYTYRVINGTTNEIYLSWTERQNYETGDGFWAALSDFGNFEAKLLPAGHYYDIAFANKETPHTANLVSNDRRATVDLKRAEKPYLITDALFE